MYKYLHHISDFMVATAHLSPVEECFYRRALDFYYLNENHYPKKPSRFSSVTCKYPRRKGCSINCAARVFVEEEDGFHNKRCDSEIAAYQK